MKTISLRRINEALINDKDYLYHFIMYVIGVLFGSIVFKHILFENISVVLEQELYASIINTIIKYSMIFFLNVFIGSSIFGYCFTGFFMLLFGVISSYDICVYYELYKFAAIAYLLLLVIPELSFVFIVLLNSTIYSYNLSREVCSCIKNKETNSDFNLANYIKIQVKYYILLIVICLINSILAYYISNIINF